MLLSAVKHDVRRGVFFFFFSPLKQFSFMKQKLKKNKHLSRKFKIDKYLLSFLHFRHLIKRQVRRNNWKKRKESKTKHDY